MNSRLFLLPLCLALSAPVYSQQKPPQRKVDYLILDGNQYKDEQQVKWALSNPAVRTAPYVDKGGWLVVPRSLDGHYYIPAFLNGFPVTFLVDTGASKTAVGAGIAKNAGMRVGVATQAKTANGVGKAAETIGNQLSFGATTLTDVPAAVMLNPGSNDVALLGMDVLKRFRIFQGQDSLQLQKLD